MIVRPDFLRRDRVFAGFAIAITIGLLCAAGNGGATEYSREKVLPADDVWAARNNRFAQGGWVEGTPPVKGSWRRFDAVDRGPKDWRLPAEGAFQPH